MNISRFGETKLSQAYGILCGSLPSTGDRDGLYPTVCRIPRGGASQTHAHFESELFFIVSGSGTMRIAEETEEVSTGDLVRIAPFQEHTLTNNGNDELAFLSVYSEDFTTPPLPKSAVVTAAPPTPNGPLHLGHISGPYLASDVVTRYLRLRSVPTRSHCGTDDHQNYVGDEKSRRAMRARIEAGLEKMKIGFEEFIEPKTDCAYQNKIQRFAAMAIALGVIEKENLALPYCATCEHFLVDALIEGRCPGCEQPSRGGCEVCGIVVPPQDLLRPACAICRKNADLKTAEVFTFPLGRYLPAVLSDLHKLSLAPRLVELAERVRLIPNLKVLLTYPDAGGKGLRLEGTDQSLHVWFEMAAHYQSFAQSKDFWIHTFGFDNSFYYLLFIPALLRALDPKSKLPDAVIANEFLLLDGRKFSTSRNHAIWADEFPGNVEHLRLFLCLQRPATREADFSAEKFQRFSEELAPQFVSLAQRARALSAGKSGSISPRVLVGCNRFMREMEGDLEPTRCDLRSASRRLLAFLDSMLQAGGTDRDERLRMQTMATALAPFAPRESEKLFEALALTSSSWVTDWARFL